MKIEKKFIVPGADFENTADAYHALRKIVGAEPRVLSLALSVLLARHGSDDPPLDFVVGAARQIASLALSNPTELIAEIDAAAGRFASFTCEGSEIPPGPDAGQLWWVTERGEYGGEGYLIVEDVDLATDPIEVLFNRDNYFDRSSMEWCGIVTAATRSGGSDHEHFLYIGQAPPELRDDYVRSEPEATRANA